MINQRTLGSKILYKIFITTLKYIPITLVVLFIIGFTLNYFGISSLIISCIGGSSIIFITLLYMMSYVFRFCVLYRLPLHYVVVSSILCVLNSVFKIMVAITLYRLLAILFGFGLILYISYWYKNRNKPKIDHIKEFCSRYNLCNC